MKTTHGGSLDQATRLHLALAEHLGTICRIAWFVGDDDVDEDERIQQLAWLALDQSEIVPPGRERAWLLRTLLGLLGARVCTTLEPPRELPRLPRAAGDIVVADGAFLRLSEALRCIDKAERASLVLAVQEGLSSAEGARIQGGSRVEFARRVSEAMALLDDEMFKALMRFG